MTLERDSCTYMYGQPILWNDRQQVFGEEIRVYNNDSTVELRKKYTFTVNEEVLKTVNNH